MLERETFIFRKLKDRQNPFVRADKGFINDPSISYKAKGIMLYLLSKPDHWKLIPADLKNWAKDSDTSPQLLCSCVPSLREQRARFVRMTLDTFLH